MQRPEWGAIVGVLAATACAQTGTQTVASATPAPDGMSRERMIEESTNEVFAEHDTDGDDRISRAEFAVLARAQNPDAPADFLEETIGLAFSQLDRDGNGYVTRTEYALVAAQQI